MRIADIDLEMLASLLEDAYGGESFIDPRTGELHPYPFETGIMTDRADAENWVTLETLPAREAYEDMAVFADSVADQAVSERLNRALEARHPFRGFKNAIYRESEAISRAWNRFRDANAQMRAVGFLFERDLIDRDDAETASQALLRQSVSALAAVGREDLLEHAGCGPLRGPETLHPRKVSVATGR